MMNDETLPNFIKRKHPKKEEKKKQSARTSVQSCKRAPKEVSHTEERGPLSTETCTSGMKHIN
jgi:hypothetical protein